MAINVRKEFEKKEAAKPSAAKTPVQTSAANQRESRVPAPAFTQTLNLYGTPATSARPSGGSTRTRIVKSTPAKTDAQINAELAAVQAGLDEILKNVNAFGATYGVGGAPTGAGATTTQAATAPTPAKKEIIPNVAYDTIQKILESYRITGLASVLESIRDEYPEINSTELLTLLQFDSRYNAKFNERFAANVTRMKVGKPVYSPGEYLKLEQAFDKVLTSYNQPTFKNQTYYDKWIVGDVDPVEVSERVQLGYDRVLSDDPVTRAFNKFYSALGYSDIVAGMLDPVNQLPALQQKVKAAEIGGAALRQGFKADEISLEATGSTLGADILAKQGITKAQAEAGYSQIAGLLPTAEKLSSIYGKTEEKYGRLEAEQESFQQLASAERKRRRLTELETAQYKGTSGTGRTAVSISTPRSVSSAGQF